MRSSPIIIFRVQRQGPPIEDTLTDSEASMTKTCTKMLLKTRDTCSFIGIPIWDSEASRPRPVLKCF